MNCLDTPHHFTHDGVCYVGDHAYISISNPQNPQPVNWHTVPEPTDMSLILLAFGIWIAKIIYPRCRSR